MRSDRSSQLGGETAEQPTGGACAPRVRPSHVVRLVALIALGWLPLVLGYERVREAADLVELAAVPNPYLIPAHATLLYGTLPLVVVSACLAVMTPGLLLALGSQVRTTEVWILRGFALSLPVVSVSAIVAQHAVGRLLTGRAFIALLAVSSIPCALWAGRQLTTGRGSWPFGSPSAGRTLALAILVPMLLVVVLMPKFLWESFNGDGAHAFETARLAVRNVLPFWDSAAGEVAHFPGMSSMLFAYPASWFVRLFGELEASVRFPYLLALTVLHSALVSVACMGRPSDSSGVSRVLIWGSLVVYSVVQAFNSTYDPYSADLSMPGLPDTLQVLAFLGFVHAYVQRHWGWTAWFLVLTLSSSPSGVFLVGLWLAAAVWQDGHAERVPVRRGLMLLLAVLAVFSLVGPIRRWLGLPEPGAEHGFAGLLVRFAFLQLTDWTRLLWVIVPVGIAPAGAFLAWRRLDRLGRTVLAVVVGHFVVFYVQAHVHIHQFVPAMVLPIAALWRLDILQRRQWRAAVAATTLLALWLSWPPNTRPVVAARIVGSAVEDRPFGYAELQPAAFRRGELLETLFPPDFQPAVPTETYGGSTLAWMYYAHRAAASPLRANYVLTTAFEVPPEGARWHAANEAGVVYVRSDAEWQRHRSLRPPTPAGSPLYWTPRGIFFRSVPLEGGPWVLDIPAVLNRWGIDVEGLAREFGILR